MSIKDSIKAKHNRAFQFSEAKERKASPLPAQLQHHPHCQHNCSSSHSFLLGVQMTWFPAVLLFSWLCLYGQIPAQAMLTELSYVSIAVKDSHYLLTTTYKSTAPAQVTWWFYDGTQHHLPPSDYSHSWNGTGQSGVTWVELDRRRVSVSSGVYLSLGHLQSHFFDLEWNLPTTTSTSAVLSTPLMTVQPGTDLPYAQGEAVEVSIGVQENQGKGHLRVTDPALFFTGENFNSSTNTVDVVEEASFFEQSWSDSKDGVTTTTVKFHTDRYSVNGLFYAELFSLPPYQAVSPLRSLSEKLFLKVHHQSYSGPFPDHFVSADFNEAGHQKHCGRYYCSLFCTSYGNDLQAVTILKEYDNGTRVDLKASVDTSRPFQAMAHLDMDPASSDTPGTYVCSATTLKTTKTDKVKVTVGDL